MVIVIITLSFNFLKDQGADSENGQQSELKQDGEKYEDNDRQNAQDAYNRVMDEFKQNIQLRTEENRVVNKRSEANAADPNNEEGNLLFENYLKNHQKSNSKIGFNNQDSSEDVSEPSRYIRHYYNTGKRKQQTKKNEAPGLDLNRDRRQVSIAGLESEAKANLKDGLETPDISNEDEEAAIKRHVKKLNNEELNQLLNSLSEEKRDILKKIIDNDSETNNLIKREITKKAGAVEENNLIESGQLQSLNPLAVNSGTPVSQNTEAYSTEKQTDNLSSNYFYSGQMVDTTPDQKADIVNPSEAQSQSLGTANYEQAQSLSTGSCSSMQDVDLAAGTKSANKREAPNGDYKGNHGEATDKSYYNEHDGDTGYLTAEEDESSEIDDGESIEDSETPQKREVPYQKYSELTDCEKSLEESFPNSKAYEDSDPYAASDMLPLVRVKRKNAALVPNVLKKRASALTPDEKVGFVPYKAENDDDNIEANEFDDNGFYASLSNFNKDMNSNLDSESSKQEAEASIDNSGFRDSSNLNENLKDDKENLGSDTDGVLSGVEGVDDNLMLSKQNPESVDQNWDSAELSGSEQAGHNRVKRSLPEEKYQQKDSGNPVKAPIYHEIDAFGPLPQNHETEAGRFKRIRRVKQRPDSGKNIS